MTRTLALLISLAVIGVGWGWMGAYRAAPAYYEGCREGCGGCRYDYRGQFN